jgi:hypothetical protein
MIKYLTSVALVVLLVGGGGALALAVSGNPDNGSNAAISQYGEVPTTPPGEQGVKGTNEEGGKGTNGVKGKSQQGGAGNPGGSGNSGAVETASTGPVAAAGGLPFTGFDALALGIIGLLLLFAGLMQRRFEAKRRS